MREQDTLNKHGETERDSASNTPSIVGGKVLLFPKPRPAIPELSINEPTEFIPDETLTVGQQLYEKALWILLHRPGCRIVDTNAGAALRSGLDLSPTKWSYFLQHYLNQYPFIQLIKDDSNPNIFREISLSLELLDETVEVPPVTARIIDKAEQVKRTIEELTVEVVADEVQAANTIQRAEGNLENGQVILLRKPEGAEPNMPDPAHREEDELTETKPTESPMTKLEFREKYNLVSPGSVLGHRQAELLAQLELQGGAITSDDIKRTLFELINTAQRPEDYNKSIERLLKNGLISFDETTSTLTLTDLAWQFIADYRVSFGELVKAKGRGEKLIAGTSYKI